MALSSPVLKSPWTSEGVAATIASAMADYRAEVGARLRSLREARDLSQEDAAHEIGVTAKTLSRWENGRRWPYAHHWTAIKAFYGADPREGVASPGPVGLSMRDSPDGTGPDDGRLAALEDQISQNSEHIRQNTERLAQIEQQLEILLSRLPAKDERTAEIHRAFEDYASRLGREVGRHPPRSRQATDLSRKAPQAAA